jgi:hypothetical protein
MISLDSLHEEEGAEDQSIHREFIEEEIGALRRLSGEETHPGLPPVRLTLLTIVIVLICLGMGSGQSPGGKSTETSRLESVSLAKCTKGRGTRERLQ